MLRFHRVRNSQKQNCRIFFIGMEIVGIEIFNFLWSSDLDLDQMTFIYELDFLKIYRMCENELPASRLSKVII